MRGQKLPRGDIQEGNAMDLLVHIDAGQKIVFPVIQDILIIGDTGSNQFRNSPFNDFLG